jgi:hypothetical protein
MPACSRQGANLGGNLEWDLGGERPLGSRRAGEFRLFLCATIRHLRAGGDYDLVMSLRQNSLTFGILLLPLVCLLACSPFLERFVANHLRKHWGDSGGTPKGQDGEIRVRTGKFKFRPRLECGAPTGAFCKGYFENKELYLAPQVGLDPTTLRLTAELLVVASRCNQ